MTELADGEHNVTVYATDEAGYVAASETVYFSVEVPEPDPSPQPRITPTDGASVLAAVIIVTLVLATGLVVYIRKYRR